MFLYVNLVNSLQKVQKKNQLDNIEWFDFAFVTYLINLGSCKSLLIHVNNC